MRIHTEELNVALKWYAKLPNETKWAITKAMRSCDKLNVDGTRVLIAAFRLHNRMMANTVERNY